MADSKLHPVEQQPEMEEMADLTAVAIPPASTAPVATGAEAPLRATLGLVMKLAMPNVVEQVLFAVIGITDTLVAGHTGATPAEIAAASAAVGVMTYLQWFCGLMTNALGVGATAIVARSIGAKRPRVANRVAGTSVAAAFCIGLAVAISLYTFAAPVVRFSGLKGLAAEYGVAYLQIMCFTVFMQSAAQIGMACLRGAGDTFRPMVITAMVMVVNFFTSSAFTFGWFGAPAWGIRGNGFGTMIAFLFSGIATFFLLLNGSTKLKVGLRHLKIVPHVLMRVMRIGFPSWLEGILLWSGQFFIVIFVINQNDKGVSQSLGQTLDGVTIAAHNAVLRIESLAFLPGYGFGIAASALVGQFLGSKQPEEARRAAFLAGRLAFVTMCIAALPMIFIPQMMLRWLVDSAPVVLVGHWPMVLAGLAQPGFAIAIVAGSALKGAGETVLPMISTIVGVFLIRMPVLLVILWGFNHAGHFSWGLIAVWIGIVVDLNFRAVLNASAFIKGKWIYKKV